MYCKYCLEVNEYVDKNSLFYKGLDNFWIGVICVYNKSK